MKASIIVLLLFALESCQSVDINVEGLSAEGEKSNKKHKEPPTDDNKAKYEKPGENDRKSSQWMEEIIANDETPADFDIEELNLDDFPKIEVILAEDFASAIKIVKAPDLSKESDSKKVADMFNEIVKSREKMMQKYESELEELARLEAQLEAQENNEEAKEKTPEEVEADNLYEAALTVLNKTRSDKVAGHAAMLKAAEKGHQLARLHVAWNQLLGHPVDLNFEAARATFVELVEKGIPEAHMGIGFMYATGIGLNVSQAKALVHYTMAALGDDSWAQMILGYRYWSGVTVASNCEQALGFYRKVAAKVAAEVTFSGGAAVHRIRLLDEVENSGPSSGILDNDLIEYYRMLADKGDVQAQVGLGQLYYQGGRGIPLDHQKALQYFTQASNSENGVAMAFLGKIYLEGSENVKADNDTAFKYFKKSADLGNPVGQSGLGIMYLQGKGVPKDTTKALKYFTQAAEQGWVDGQLQLGNMYFGGIGVKRDFKQANKYFNLASQSGHVLAFYNLAQMHADGLGMIRSCPTAVELFKNVAERGKWAERLMIAYQDYRHYRFEEAFMQYILLAELGYEVAQSNAAFLLDRGEVNLFNDRDEEFVRALQYWGRAAAQGYSAAQVKLGDYHYYGWGTGVDFETAASHYRMASEQQHNAQAMFNLGYMHEHGLGMNRDIHLAKRCYDLAAETSTDAKVPVALALLKLQLVYKLEALKESPLNIIFKLDENIASNWDLYLITILTLFLGMIIYFRRPPYNPPPPPAQQQQQQQDRPPQPEEPNNQDANIVQ